MEVTVWCSDEEETAELDVEDVPDEDEADERDVSGDDVVVGATELEPAFDASLRIYSTKTRDEKRTQPNIKHKKKKENKNN